MSCDKYLELLALRLDGELSAEEDRELEDHLAVCPDCRAAGAQLAALQGAFPELEEVPAPEGFARGVMDRIRAEEKPKVIPLFKRPQVRALAGLAACLVLVVGLYGVSRPRYLDKRETMDVTVRSFNRDAAEELEDVSACEALPEDGDAPQIAAYSAPTDGAEDVEPAAADCNADDRWCNSAAMVLERLPQGAEDVIPPETVVSYNVATGEEGYRWVTESSGEALAQIERLAEEQEMCVERSSAPVEELLYDLVILEAD